MKKRFAAFLAVMIVALSGCGQSDSYDDATAGADTDTVAGTDTSDSDYSVQYTITIPDDFSASDVNGYEFFYVNEDGSAISLNIQERDSSFKDIGPDEMREALEEVYAQNYEEEVQISDLYFLINDVSGYPAYRYSFTYELQGCVVLQLVVGVDADATYTFTYTDMSGDWMELFEESAAGIEFSEP